MSWHKLAPDWTLGLLLPSEQGLCTHSVSWEQIPAPLTTHLHWDLCQHHLTWEKTIPGTALAREKKGQKAASEDVPGLVSFMSTYIFMPMLDSAPMLGKGAENKALTGHGWHRLTVQSGAHQSWTVSLFPLLSLSGQYVSYLRNHGSGYF